MRGAGSLPSVSRETDSGVAILSIHLLRTKQSFYTEDRTGQWLGLQHNLRCLFELTLRFGIPKYPPRSGILSLASVSDSRDRTLTHDVPRQSLPYPQNSIALAMMFVF